MPAALNRLARAGLGFLPLSLCERLVPRPMIALLYHAIGDPPLSHVRHLYPHKSAAEFEADLAWLARRYRTVSYDEIEAGVTARKGRPVMHVTFDDGYAECATIARPILLKLGIPCTFFVTTDFIDNRLLFHRNKAALCLDALDRLSTARASAFLGGWAGEHGRQVADPRSFRSWLLGLAPADEPRIDRICSDLGVDIPAYLREHAPYLTTDQVLRLHRDGFTVGAHGRRHAPIGGLAAGEARDEILSSCATVRVLTGRDRVPFAFPHSADGVDRTLLRSLAAENPGLGLCFDTRQLRRDDPLIVNRITVDRPPIRRGTTNLPGEIGDAYRVEVTAAIKRALPGSER